MGDIDRFRNWCEANGGRVDEGTKNVPSAGRRTTPEVINEISCNLGDGTEVTLQMKDGNASVNVEDVGPNTSLLSEEESLRDVDEINVDDHGRTIEFEGSKSKILNEDPHKPEVYEDAKVVLTKY